MSSRTRTDLPPDERTADRIEDLEDEMREVRNRIEDLRVGQERLGAQLAAHAAASEQGRADLARRLDELSARGDGIFLPSRVVVAVVLAILAGLGVGVGAGVGGAAAAPPSAQAP